MQVLALIQKTLTIPILKAVCRFIVLFLNTFPSFSIFATGFKKMCLQWVTFPKKSSSIIIDVMGVSLSHWFVVTGGKIIS